MENRKLFSEIKKILEENGIYILKLRTTLNGKQAYKIQNKAYDPFEIWTAADIRQRYEIGGFV